MVALANILELAEALDPKVHDATTDLEELALRRVQGHKRYMDFREEFSANHELKVGDNIMEPTTFLFDTTLVQFAVTLYKYKKMVGDAKFDPTTLALLDNRLQNYFSTYFPRLKAQYDADKKKKTKELPYLESFNWLGESFEVLRVRGKKLVHYIKRTVTHRPRLLQIQAERGPSLTPRRSRLHQSA
jgi:hypothetical protein